MTIHDHPRLHKQPDGSTTIVCLCGSASQKSDFEKAEEREELAGKIVLTLNIYSKSTGITLTDDDIALMTAIHYQKIDMAHEILVILKPDPSGTLSHEKRLGDHAREERDYASGNGKKVEYFFT